MNLSELEVYKISLELSEAAWIIYKNLPVSDKIIIGDQFLRSTDSIGANIAEGFGRYHYLDSIRFYYHSRGSLWETKHWLELLYKREFITESTYFKLKSKLDTLGVKINNLVSTTRKRSNK